MLEACREKDYNTDQLTARRRSDSTAITGTAQQSVKWKVCKVSEFDKGQLVSPSETEKYDISLYSPPGAVTVPSELDLVVSNPVFRIEDLSMDVIMRRYDTASKDVTGIVSMEFGVLYGDILVKIVTYNMEPQWLYEQMMSLPRN